MRILPVGRVPEGTARTIIKNYHNKQMAFAKTITEIRKLRRQGIDPHEEYPRIARESGLDTYQLYIRELERLEKEMNGIV